MTPRDRRHMLSILVDDRYGELARIVGLFSSRGYNIDSLSVSSSLEAGKSRVLLTTRGAVRLLEQILKQLNKLVRVHKVQHLVAHRTMQRELCVATVRPIDAVDRSTLNRALKLADGKVLGLSAMVFTVQVVGSPSDIDEFVDMLRPVGLQEMVRSGPIAVSLPRIEGSREVSTHLFGDARGEP
jgi:acetolactate synthase I/III small subunit